MEVDIYTLTDAEVGPDVCLRKLGDLHEGRCRSSAAAQDVTQLRSPLLQGADLERQRGKAQHRHQHMVQHGSPTVHRAVFRREFIYHMTSLQGSAADSLR